MNMASQEHKELALFIKAVHHSLRKQYRKLGHKEAWKKHCTQKDLLQKYASTMHLLATKYWDQSEQQLVNISNCRIHWIVMTCMKYFLNGEKETELMKEVKKKSKLNGKTIENEPEIYQDTMYSILTEKDCKKIKLLDVGSCYNPFKQFSLFDVVSIDIAPATDDVWQCDFLSINISDYGQNFESLELAIARNEIPANLFDVVVFSLFLEYVPCPQERYKCCQKAYKLLNPEGLLFIITPDSRHATANAPIMRHWRTVLGKLGFHRIYYEKLPHLHCMAYRKSFDQSVPQQWACKITVKLPASFPVGENSLYIPQDNNCYSEEEKEEEENDGGNDLKMYKRSESDNALLADMFTELPGN